MADDLMSSCSGKCRMPSRWSAWPLDCWCTRPGWLLLAVALIPAVVGEAHFNALGYALNFQWTPERTPAGYVRQMGASVEPAKK